MPIRLKNMKTLNRELDKFYDYLSTPRQPIDTKIGKEEFQEKVSSMVRRAYAQLVYTAFLCGLRLRVGNIATSEPGG
jgi:hypothetical protein